MPENRNPIFKQLMDLLVGHGLPETNRKSFDVMGGKNFELLYDTLDEHANTAKLASIVNQRHYVIAPRPNTIYDWRKYYKGDESIDAKQLVGILEENINLICHYLHSKDPSIPNNWDEFKEIYGADLFVNTSSEASETSNLDSPPVIKADKPWFRRATVIVALFALLIISFALLDIRNIFKRNMDAEPVDKETAQPQDQLDKYPLQKVIDKDPQFIEGEYIDKEVPLHEVLISVNSSWSNARLLVNGQVLSWDESSFNIKKKALPEGIDMELKLITDKDTCNLGSIVLSARKKLNTPCQ